MISFIKGEIVKKGLDYIILECNNIGYFINTSLPTLKLYNEGDKVFIYTYLHIREDILALYGFCRPEEIDMFKKLITVSGVGPKAGLAILSTHDSTTVKEIILTEDAVKMSKAPGIGKKTASKIILELKDKVGSLENLVKGEMLEPSQPGKESSDILNVLISLGFTQLEAMRTLDEIDITGKSEEDIIKEALKNIHR